MQAYVIGSRLSEHMAWSPENYLICTNVVLCRTGAQQYAERELTDSGSNERITVHRAAEDVLSDVHAASLEGKPVTENHPPFFLSPQNIAAFQKGHCQNVRVGKLPTGESCLIGDVIITDKGLADKVVAGRLREISTGYECRYRERADGDLDQTDFLANHIAIVPQGRANVGRASMVKIFDGGQKMHTDEEIQAAIDTLTRVTRSLAIEPPRQTADADTTAKNATTFAASYADSLNQTGAKMRGRDCRSGLRHAQDEAVPQLSLQQRLDAHERAEKYARECRQLHRR